MPGLVNPVIDEREGLLGFLAQQRYVVRLTAHGLTDDQARSAPAVTTLSVGGLIKHLTAVERFWIDNVVLERPPVLDDDYGSNLRMEPGERLAAILERYDEGAGQTEAAIAEIDDVGRAVPVPKGVPWFPADVEAWSVRWVLLHLIEETARHAGHADIIRETIDGATAFPLMAAAEGWPPSPWIQPWEAAAP